jgi:23S rRNA (uracil1939-C5)-methyltransferase
MTEHLVISRIGHRGDGIADTDAGPVYVPYTLPGERVEVESVRGHPDRRHLLHVDTVSADRIAPFCPHFGVCGGCAIQHWAEKPYREWKRSLLLTALVHAGLPTPVGELVDAHGEGRRRAVFHARRGTHDVVEVGFSALRAHTIVAIDRCPILAPSLENAVEIAWAIAEILEPTQKPLDIQVTGTLNGLDIDIRGSGPLDRGHTAALARLAAAKRVARITRHGEFIAQNAPPIISMGPAQVTLPPGSFLQATQLGEETLAQLALACVGRAKTIADLFAGVGPFALRFAQHARVSAVDSNQDALNALARAASSPGLKPVETLRRDLFRRPLSATELMRFDAVIFDPPRQGAEAQATEIARSRVPTVVAVSCNPSTFARDARILVDGGYRLTAVTPVDQFRHSAHVEIVAAFSR